MCIQGVLKDTDHVLKMLKAGAEETPRLVRDVPAHEQWGLSSGTYHPCQLGVSVTSPDPFSGALGTDTDRSLEFIGQPGSQRDAPQV